MFLELGRLLEGELGAMGVADIRHKATSTALNPRDLNILLVGYDGGVVAWDFQKKEAVRTFELVLPPGAPGGGSYLAEVSEDTCRRADSSPYGPRGSQLLRLWSGTQMGTCSLWDTRMGVSLSGHTTTPISR